ncbi:MAG: DNA methyltransferase [Betaproteobacteria bacterium]
MKLDLDFRRETSTYSSHGLHAFAARFPPQLPGVFIERFTKPGEVVLDPMNGSGTTTLEAYLRGRRALGCDIDPLAVRIARVKTTPVPFDLPRIAGSLVKNAKDYLEEGAAIRKCLDDRFDEKTRQFIDYWFFPETQRELTALLLAMEDHPSGSPARELAEVVFSGIIVTKSGGVSRARDLAHTRPHLDSAKARRDAIKDFGQRLAKFTPAIAALPDQTLRAGIVQCSVRQLAIRDESVDLIVTSPPYANAIDYVRANKFSLVWLGQSVSRLGQLRGRYIGSEATRATVMGPLTPSTEDVLCSLNALDPRKAAVLRKYYLEMREALREMSRVLVPGHRAVLVVGTSTMRGLDVRTPGCLADIAEHDAGFEVENVLRRSLDRDRRMMPFAKGKTLIERRMATEEVIVLKKPPGTSVR